MCYEYGLMQVFCNILIYFGNIYRPYALTFIIFQFSSFLWGWWWTVAFLSLYEILVISCSLHITVVERGSNVWMCEYVIQVVLLRQLGCNCWLYKLMRLYDCRSFFVVINLLCVDMQNWIKILESNCRVMPT